jgi:hypothetical protein
MIAQLSLPAAAKVGGSRFHFLKQGEVICFPQGAHPNIHQSHTGADIDFLRIGQVLAAGEDIDSMAGGP